MLHITRLIVLECTVRQYGEYSVKCDNFSCLYSYMNVTLLPFQC